MTTPTDPLIPGPPPERKPFLEEPLTRGEKALVGAVKGGLGGAFCGYAGGRFLDLGDVALEVGIAAAVGAALGVVVGLVSAQTAVGCLKEVAFWVPGTALTFAAVWGGHRLIPWAFGLGVQQWAGGPGAAVLGGLAGAALLAGLGYTTGPGGRPPA
jgi:hypothetical protein